MSKSIFFHPNGNTSVFIDSEQVPELQDSWFLLFIDKIVAQGHDPLDFNYMLPSGQMIKVFKTLDGTYNWDFVNN